MAFHDYDESGNLLDPVPGLGLASAPATELMTPGVGDAGAFDQSGSAGLSFKTPSLNLASPPPAQSEQEYLQNLPTMQKIGLALQAFSAGVAGRPSPVTELLKQRRAQQQADRADLLNTINVISKGTEVLRKMPPGIARDAVAAQLGKAVGGGEIAKVFTLAGDQQQEINTVLATFSDPDVQNTLIKACSGSADFRACVMTQARDKNFMDRAHSQADSKRMPDIVRKLSAVTDQIGKTGVLNEFKTEDGKYEIPFAKLIELNDKAKIFSPQEMDTLRRNEDMLSPFGIKTTAAIKAGAAEKAKIAERPAKEDFKEGATRRILDAAGTELQQEFKGGQWVTIGKRKDKPTEKPISLAQERHDEQVLEARRYLTENGIKSIEDVKKFSEKEIPTRPGGSVTKPNPNYDPEAMRKWRLAGEPLFADTKAKRDAAKGKPRAEAAPAEEPKAEAAPAAAVSLTPEDRQRILDKMNEEIARGVDPVAASAWVKKKYGLIVTLEKKK